jgi:pimeloyl-ACP methyl ester carboxylesterase
MPLINIKGLKINYMEQGTGDEAIVFVHGFFPSAHGSWKETLQLLPLKFHAYAPDLRGYGQSERVKEGYTIAQFAEDIYNFSHEMKLKEFTIVGHSMGGAIVQQFALDYPQVLKSAVLVASVPAHGRPWAADTSQQTQRDTSPATLRGFMNSIFTRVPTEQRLQEIINDYVAMGDDAYNLSRDAFNYFNQESRMREIAVPVLIVAGEKDDAIPVSELCRTANAIPGSRFEIFKGLGHCLHIEDAQHFVDLLTNFINQANLKRA